MSTPVVRHEPRVPSPQPSVPGPLRRPDRRPAWGSRLPALGRHGEGWVAGQVAVMALIVVLGLVGASWPSTVAGTLIIVGAAVAASGLVMLVGGAVALGSALTPMPRPRDAAALRQDGVYRLCRHPMYGGGIMLATGWALGRSPLVFAGVVLAAVFLDVKSRREEAWLEAQFEDYPAYRAHVRWRLLPWVH